MANIYLRISSYVAAFMRSTGDGQSLDKDQPITFSPYTQEYPVLVKGLRIVPEAHQHSASCYSQSAWQNMLRGCPPQGGSQVLNRNANDYLTFPEVCALDKLKNKNRSESFDFLCIALPKEVRMGDRIVKVNKSFTIDTRPAQELRRLMREAFIREYLRFEQDSITFARGQGIERTAIEILERFMMEHDIPVSYDDRETDTMKRLARRWREEARQLAQDPRYESDINIARIDEKEIRRAERKEKNA